MIYYPFDDDPPPFRERPSGEFLNYAGKSTPGKIDDPFLISEKMKKRERRDLLILVGIKCGLTPNTVAMAIGLSYTGVRYVLKKYSPYLKEIKTKDKYYQEQFHKLSKTQQRIELGCLAVEVGLSIRFVQKSLGISSNVLMKRRKR